MGFPCHVAVLLSVTRHHGNSCRRSELLRRRLAFKITNLKQCWDQREEFAVTSLPDVTNGLGHETPVTTVKSAVYSIFNLPALISFNKLARQFLIADL